MNLREKIGQLFMLGFHGTAPSKDLRDLFKAYHPGGVILFSRNLEDPEQAAHLTNALQKLAPKMPLLISIDQEGGRVARLPKGFTLFPGQGALGQAGTAPLAYAFAEVTARELRAIGVNMDLTPVLDVNTNPGNPIIGDRAFGPDPELVETLGLAVVAGLQDNGVLACGKHFPGHGDTAADSHKELPTVSHAIDRLRDIELRPFAHCFANGLAAVMTAHVRYPALDPDTPATLSPAILTDLLRAQLHFQGLVLTDDLEMHAIIDHYGIEDAAIRALRAGADILLICKDHDRQVAAMEAVYRAVKGGDLPELLVEHAVLRILEAKNRWLIPYAPVDPKHAAECVGTKRHREVAQTIREAAAQATV
ncbi:MAG: beta-N-acetylhexosaminidase [Nitrospirae bacterium]|nr:MAG: beta-N-acetylhexosaminidase [Nitrospirota bacterium]